MGIAGLAGGLGPESTIDYYRRILDSEPPVIAGVPVLDTTALHVAAILARLREPSPG